MAAPEDKPTSDDFEAHKKKRLMSEDAEPPEKLGEVSEDQAIEDEDDDFEAHKKKRL
jgi:hypothetical protein